MKEVFNIARVDANIGNDPMTEEYEAIKNEPGVNLLMFDCLTEQEIIASAQKVDIIVTHFASITDRVMAELPRLRAVVRYGVGYDSIDVIAATQRGVMVINVPDFCGEEVSNHVIMFILAYSKKLLMLNTMTKAGQWEEAKQKQQPMRCIHGETLGIIGCGNIGRQVAKKAWMLDMQLIGYDKYLSQNLAKAAGIQLMEFDELLKTADYITLHVTLTEETRHLINDDALSRMKSNCVLINTSRGPVVNEEALIYALRTGRIAGACLDVFEIEPIAPGSPLLSLDNVILTPHCASYSNSSFSRLKRSVMQEAIRIKNGQQPVHIVNMDVLDHTRR